MILYKYTTYENALKILLEQKFRYTQPYSFNDPFELYPSVEEYFNNEQFEEILDSILQPNILEEKLNETIHSAYDKLNEFQKAIIPYQQYSSIQKVRIEQEIEKSNLPLKELIKAKVEKYDMKKMMNIEYHKLLNSLIGIFSLSKNKSNILMWSHYTNSHTGVIIKIIANQSYFEYLDKVDYSADRPKIKFSKRDYTTEESLEVYKKVFFTKSLGWLYESEYRDMKPLIKGYHSEKVDKNGFLIILFDFPLEIIEGIIFGVRVNDNKITEFISQIENKYSNLNYEFAFLNPDKFELDIHQITNAV